MIWSLVPSFSVFPSFNTVDNNPNVQHKFSQCLDSNCRPLVLEATTLPTVPQLLPKNLLTLMCTDQCNLH